MKIKSIASLLIVSLTLFGSAVGCKKNLQKTTPLPGVGSGSIGGAEPTGPIGEMPPIDTTGASKAGLDAGKLDNIPLPTTDRGSWAQDRETFAAQTVYFDFDKSNIKTSEVPKIEQVAAMIKTMSGKALRIEGHCDERGTEEYNRALGERRALSVREYLVTLGVDAQLVDTISFGEDQPVELGHNEAAWAKNRRGVFIVLSPPAAK
jgi:peptidoglycan-associated lipoprotein